jgi:proteasome lid subunit RPN8/RPN11
MEGTVRVSWSVVERMVEEARRDAGVECCGLLAGRGETITHLYPAANALGSATAYEIAPRELFRIFRAMRADGLDHLGIYHSHPRGPNVPSPRDVQQAYYPDAAYFIVSPAQHLAHPVRAFRIRDARFAELAIEVV